MNDVAPVVSRTRSAGHWIVLSLCLAAPLGLIAARVLFTPDARGFGTHEQLGLPPCRSLDWFGVPCPGCGVTTAFAWFAHAQVLHSLVAQPFGFALGAVLLFAAPLALLGAVRGLDLGEQARRFNRPATWFALGLLAALSWLYKCIVVWTQ